MTEIEFDNIIKFQHNLNFLLERKIGDIYVATKRNSQTYKVMCLCLESAYTITKKGIIEKFSLNENEFFYLKDLFYRNQMLIMIKLMNNMVLLV